MTLDRIIRRLTYWWTYDRPAARRARGAQLRSAIPGLRDIDTEIATCRRRHRPVRALERQRRDLIHAALRSAGRA